MNKPLAIFLVVGIAIVVGVWFAVSNSQSDPVEKLVVDLDGMFRCLVVDGKIL